MTSTVIYEGGLRTVATHLQSGTVIHTDAPTDNRGQGERFSPSDLVATSLASCMLTIMGMKAMDLDLDLKGLRVDVQKIMKSDPRRVGGINLTFHLPDTLQLTEKQILLLERSANTCPVIFSIHPDIDVQAKFNWPAPVTEG